MVRGQGPGSSCSTTSSVTRLGQRADVLEHREGLRAGVDLAPARGEQGDRHGCRPELERDGHVLLERRQHRLDGLALAFAEDVHDREASTFARRYSRYGAGSISGEPVSRSMVSFGVSFRPRE